MSEVQTRDLRRAGIILFATSFVVLFQELALIRWIGAEVRVLAYFPNVVLISAFLGLGIGSLLARRAPSMIVLWPPLLLIAVAVAFGISRIAFTQQAVSEHLWLLYYDLPKSAPVVHGIRLPILLTFVLSGLTFIPLGQLIGRQLDLFRSHGRALDGYCWDLFGSLIGVAGFALVSFLGVVPLVWFVVIFAAAAIFLRGGVAIGVAAACFVALLCVVYFADTADAWSPYYAIRKIDLPNDQGFLILANGSQHQYAAPSRRSDTVRGSDAAMLRAGYHFPYQILGRRPERVLVLGAGSGNDAAVALDNGAGHVDAVEIDPVILDLGRRWHPDRPYQSDRVRTINNDARSFLNHTSDQYDLVIFGALDSMTRLSALSNVRLDNFVYTRECMTAARRHVAPGGGLVLYFAVPPGYIDDHLRALLTSVFGAPPKVVTFGQYHRLYLAGPAFARLQAPAPLPSQAIVPSDDWPYLYLRSRSLTSFYLELIAIFAAIAVLAIGFSVWAHVTPSVSEGPGGTGGANIVSGTTRPSRPLADARGDIRFDRPMFFFGLAFLLLETKSVTEMNLVWGSTWLTSAVVFGAILLMVLAGTLLMRWKPLPWRYAVAGLIAGLIVNYLTPVQSILSTNASLRLLLSIFFVGTPIFFASICFALLFRDEPATDVAFGWNVLGAVLGGLIEFSSMIIGLKALTLIALASYLIAVTRRP
jgi:SAM-dependent methyltransferase